MHELDADHQRKYRSNIGMWLYLTKYSSPDICNIIRELSKCMESTTWGTYNKLMRVIKLLDNKLRCNLFWKVYYSID
jgi:hypothetical protein